MDPRAHPARAVGQVAWADREVGQGAWAVQEVSQQPDHQPPPGLEPPPGRAARLEVVGAHPARAVGQVAWADREVGQGAWAVQEVSQQPDHQPPPGLGPPPGRAARLEVVGAHPARAVGQVAWADREVVPGLVLRQPRAEPQVV